MVPKFKITQSSMLDLHHKTDHVFPYVCDFCKAWPRIWTWTGHLQIRLCWKLCVPLDEYKLMNRKEFKNSCDYYLGNLCENFILERNWERICFKNPVHIYVFIKKDELLEKLIIHLFVWKNPEKVGGNLEKFIN